MDLKDLRPALPGEFGPFTLPLPILFYKKKEKRSEQATTPEENVAPRDEMEPIPEDTGITPPSSYEEEQRRAELEAERERKVQEALERERVRKQEEEILARQRQEEQRKAETKPETPGYDFRWSDHARYIGEVPDGYFTDIITLTKDNFKRTRLQFMSTFDYIVKYHKVRDIGDHETVQDTVEKYLARKGEYLDLSSGKFLEIQNLASTSFIQLDITRILPAGTVTVTPPATNTPTIPTKPSTPATTITPITPKPTAPAATTTKPEPLPPPPKPKEPGIPSEKSKWGYPVSTWNNLVKVQGNVPNNWGTKTFTVHKLNNLEASKFTTLREIAYEIKVRSIRVDKASGKTRTIEVTNNVFKSKGETFDLRMNILDYLKDTGSYKIDLDSYIQYTMLFYKE